jgi:hypothetical protein
MGMKFLQCVLLLTAWLVGSYHAVIGLRHLSRGIEDDASGAPGKPRTSSTQSTLDSVIDIPSDGWVPVVDGVRHSLLQQTQNFSAWLRQYSDLSGCVLGASDCEAIEVVRKALWGMKSGITLEVGGLDGVTHSETLFLEKAMGFKRIIIEGDPSWRERRKENAPSAVGVQAALCSAASELHYMLHSTPEVRGIAEFMSSKYLSAWYPALAAELSTSGGNFSGVNWEQLKVPFSVVQCVRFNDITAFLHVDVIDFMVLDVEGAEMSVLQTIDWNAIRINVLVIECNHGRYDETRDYVLKSTGGRYKNLFDKQIGRNAWFVHVDFQLNSAPGWGNQTCYESPAECQSVKR